MVKIITRDGEFHVQQSDLSEVEIRSIPGDFLATYLFNKCQSYKALHEEESSFILADHEFRRVLQPCIRVGLIIGDVFFVEPAPRHLFWNIFNFSSLFSLVRNLFRKSKTSLDHLDVSSILHVISQTVDIETQHILVNSLLENISNKNLDPATYVSTISSLVNFVKERFITIPVKMQLVSVIRAVVEKEDIRSEDYQEIFDHLIAVVDSMWLNANENLQKESLGSVLHLSQLNPPERERVEGIIQMLAGIEVVNSEVKIALVGIIKILVAKQNIDSLNIVHFVSSIIRPLNSFFLPVNIKNKLILFLGEFISRRDLSAENYEEIVKEVVDFMTTPFLFFR